MISIQLIPITAAIPGDIKDLYENSFPLYERRPWQEQELLVRNNRLQLMWIEAAQLFTGFVFYWQLNDGIFIEHFAIETSARGKGTGSLVIRKLADLFAVIVLETAPVAKGEAAVRRIRFYEALGFQKFPFPYQQPPYSSGFPAQPMQLLAINCEVSASVFEAKQKEIYKKVYGISE